MEENFTQKPAEFDPKMSFTDTGSAKITDFQGEAKEKIENSNEISQETVENIQKPPEISQEVPKCAEIQSILEENSPKATNSRDFFSEANKEGLKRDFPDVNIVELQNSKNFQSFLAILAENPTLSQVYACFNSIFEQAEEKSQGRLLQAFANASTSVGSLSSAEENTDVYFTKEQVKRMSAEQIKQNFTKIRQSQAKW